MNLERITGAIAALAMTGTIGCTPTLRVEPPSEPIQINMNIKIEQEVRVRVERDLEKEFANNPELFGVPMPQSP
ncbi:MAG: YnbE family lipoprotein [Alphaproteobacteria bacterium]|nr:YnbE family lipoprotein [Alphaproteobacteria bacterium]